MGLVSLLLAACQKIGLNNEFAITRLKIGETTREQVRERVGKPDLVRDASDGSQLWEFPFGPEGSHTYMLRFDGNGVLREVQQVLSRDIFSQIKPGMRKEEVRRLLGRPRTTVVYALSQQEVWDWRFQDTSTTQLLFVVTFDAQGIVIKTGEMMPPEMSAG